MKVPNLLLSLALAVMVAGLWGGYAAAEIGAAGERAGATGAATDQTGETGETGATGDPTARFSAAEAVKDSLVRVEYTLQIDKGDEPSAGGSSFRFLGVGADYTGDASRMLEEERPLEVAGVAIGERQILVPDMLMHPRFVKRIDVCFGDQKVEAKPSALLRDGYAAYLELSAPLKGLRPLTFDASKAGPYLSVMYYKEYGAWTIGVSPLSLSAIITDSGRRMLCNDAPVQLVVAKCGTPVSMIAMSRLPVDDSWKGSPAAWTKVDMTAMQKTLADLEASTGRSILRVQLSFRSPKKDASRARYHRGGGDDESAERNVLGVLLDEKTVLVLVNMPAKTTARLEQITVHGPSAEPVKAAFKGTLKDYGCFVAELSAPLAGAAELCREDVRDLVERLLPAAEIYLQGESRVAYFSHERIIDLQEGWQRRCYASITGDEENVFLFQTDGSLVALPIENRSKVTQNSYRSSRVMTTPVALLREALAELDKSIDPNNIPLTEDQENRIAWLGVEMQPLDRELARANLVSDHSRDGDIGGVVSFVYGNSPAAAAGLKMGDILLRVHGQDQPKPLDVEIEEGYFTQTPFPWDRLDEVPEEYYDRIPQPWPIVENEFNRRLTDIGFGKKFSVELFRDGKVVNLEFDVTESPAHYNSAARFKSEALGLTVREMTYEVRRYFRKTDDEPGVIISAIEPGSKASVAGIKPYEQITDVNDKPVRSVKDFEQLIAGQTELRLAVKRMTTGRVVTVAMQAAGNAEEVKAEEEEDGE